MAEREDQPPAPPAPTAAGLSADEAERLAEKFHPSWEADEATPRSAEPKPAEPRKPIKQTLIGGVSPPASAPSERAPAPPPAATAPASAPPVAEPAARSSRPPKQHTLIGLAPPSDPPPPPLPQPKPKPKDTDLPSGPVTAGGSPDGPSGIAKVYKPKDDPAAPPVVLTEEVARAEAAANAEIEARRRVQSSARHMQTIMNIKAPEPLGARPKRRSGLWQLLLGVAAGVVVVAAVFKLSSPDSPPAEATPAATVEAPPAVAASPEPAAPVVEVAEPTVTPVAPAAGSDSRPVVLPVESASGDSVDTGAEPSKPAPARKSGKTAAAAPAPKKAAPKPAKPVVKETTSSTPAKGGVIVRETPF